jgi:hypothetical protein
MVCYETLGWGTLQVCLLEVLGCVFHRADLGEASLVED